MTGPVVLSRRAPADILFVEDPELSAVRIERHARSTFEHGNCLDRRFATEHAWRKALVYVSHTALLRYRLDHG
jgi:hypothetical protein